MRIFKGLFSKYWFWLILTVVFTAANAFTALAIPAYTGDMISEGILQPVDDAGNIIETVINIDVILQKGGIMLAFALLSMISAMAATYLSAYIATKFCGDLRSRVFRQVQSFSLNEYHKFGGASLITRSTNDVTQVQNVVFLFIRFGMMIPLMLIGSLYMAITTSPQASISLAVAVPLIGVAAAFLGIWVVKQFKVMQNRIDNMTGVMREGLTGVRVVRAFNSQEKERARFDEANKGVSDIALKVGKVMASLFPLGMVIINFTVLAVMLIIAGGEHPGKTGTEIIALITPITEYIMQILFSMSYIIMVFVLIPRAGVSVKRINEVLDTTSSIPDTDDTSGTISGNLEFKDVSYKYPGAEEYILKDINFSAKAGETVAIVGGTGSGKSTLLNLLPRFFDPTDGEVLLDGKSIAQYDLEQLRHSIGFVPQKSVLFSGTVADNIRYGKDDATEEEIKEACRIAQAEDFILEKEGGYGAQVAQGGQNFSGGQKQRLSIARALVRRPRIYVFDDSFSALDFKTDAKLRGALKEGVSDALVLIVAQRIGTIRNADKIIVMDEGRIENIGTHHELMEKSKVYREIAYSQVTEEELTDASS